jgi:Tfp pilus assembly PilM family ATPase
MARTCGLRIGPRRYELVVLDGSPKKHRITAFRTGEFPPGGEDPIAEAAAVLKAAVKEHRIPADQVAIAVDSGLAAFRTLKLPALDDAKVQEIIKFEVESQLPQWNIDEVVVDFLVLEKTDSETNLLVTAVPKSALRRELDLCARAGVEPLEAELEATAMVNAALAADVCHVDDAQVLVHIGEASTAVVVVDGGKVRSMRAVHIGALTHDPGVAAVEGDPSEAPAVPAATPEESQRRLEQVVSRIRRELGRTLSAARTAHPIDAIYVCGWELPELVGTQIQDVPVYELDVFEADSGQPATGTAPLVVAYGVALRLLGGGALKSSLRREELRYAGAFEKVELPLAVAVLLAVTWLAIFFIFELQRTKALDGDLASWLQSNRNYLINEPKKGNRGNLEKPPPELERFVEKTALRDNDLPYTRLEQLQQIERMLKAEVAKLNAQLGNTGEIAKPQSALEALTLVVGKIDSMKNEIGRVAIRRANCQYVVGKVGGQGDMVSVVLDLTFYDDAGASAATANFDELASALRVEPWVRRVEQKTSKEFPDNKGVFTDGFSVECDLSKLDRAAGGQP